MNPWLNVATSAKSLTFVKASTFLPTPESVQKLACGFSSNGFSGLLYVDVPKIIHSIALDVFKVLHK